MCRCNMNDNEYQINHIKIVNNRINDEDMCECGFEEHSPFPENYMVKVMCQYKQWIKLSKRKLD